MKFGFALRRLTMIGPGKEPAEILFKRGLNVIAGPSDTGKSFIAQCIDFTLGSGDPPKEIPQANGYDSVVLEIEANRDGRVYSLMRGLRGGEIRCISHGLPDRVLAAKHQAGNEETVSQFLLELSGLGTKKVRVNDNGKTRTLSFRDIARLVIIDEVSIIEETSPVLSGQVIHKTAESSVFRLLLTGSDDSSILAKEERKVAKARQVGKVELLENLLKANSERLAKLGGIRTLHEEKTRLTLIESLIQTALLKRHAAQVSLVPLQAKRNAAWTELKAIESKLFVLMELQTRFDMLGDQYESDLKRLEAISEAGLRLDQLKEERCPMCGALTEHHNLSHREATYTPSDVMLACKAEATKTHKLLCDLQATRIANASRVEQLQSSREMRLSELESLSAELKTLMQRNVEFASKEVDSLRDRAEDCRISIEVLERHQELNDLLEGMSKRGTKNKVEFADAAVSTAQAGRFSKVAEELLNAWHFPNLDRVSFSENDQDLVISGRARKSHGKGVRAILRAAFNLALVRLSIEEDRPYPNFILIDSPLLVYEEPDFDEQTFPQEVKKHFWMSVKSQFTGAQVIIIENSHQLPSDGELNDVKLELFTGNAQGRRGFIP